MPRLSALTAAALIVLASTPARAQTPLELAGVSAAPGTVASGAIAIAPGPGDRGTTIPFTLINGSSDGPVLALIAGTHGMEYVPILALQRLRSTIDPKSLRGAVILVHVANMPSFLGRTIYYSPVDGKNLNRVFPGKADGTISERIADAISRHVIARATHVVDLHCGDGNESLRPYAYWVTTGDPAVAEAGKAMALAFGLDHIVVDRERPEDAGASVYLSNTAILRGKPALTTETGALAGVDEEDIRLVEHGVAGLLKYLGMRPEGPDPVSTPTWIEQNVVLRAGVTGILYPAVERGYTVAKGTLVARITDFHGRVLEEIRAPFDGEVLYVVATPPVSAGEPVGMIGSKTVGVR